MDPEYNNINKLAGKRIMEVAEKNNLLAKDQYGSRKRHKSSNFCLTKVCLMDILRQKKHAGAISMNDLKGCYDRVVHTVAILTSVTCIWLKLHHGETDDGSAASCIAQY